MKTIKEGSIARYIGRAHPGLRDCVVKVLKPILNDDNQPTGYWEIQPWNEKENRYSWVTSDAGSDDLQLLSKSEAARYDRNDPTHLIMVKTCDEPTE